MTQLENRVKSAIYQLDVRHAPSRLVSLFDTATVQTDKSENPKVHTIRRKINEMPLNVTLGSLARYDALRFEALKHYFLTWNRPESSSRLATTSAKLRLPSKRHCRPHCG